MKSSLSFAAVTTAIVVSACTTAHAPNSGHLASYEGLVTRTDTVRASVAQRRDDALAAQIESVLIERAELMPEAAGALSPEDWGLVLGEMDRQVCYEVSERFAIAEEPGEGVGRIRIAATRISATNPAGSAASAAANWFIPGPIGVRLPGSTGGLAAEAELLSSDGRQAAAIVWSRNAAVVGTDDPSLSSIGDAHQLAEAFGDMVADAFAPPERKPRPIPTPDPCARYGPRNRVEGFVTRAVTGLYQPGLSGGRNSSSPSPAPQ
ncbi:DUF3313 family protein [Brevundimonas sp.]|jgi:hypothetical protein|uniref:DUF3313 family protein n=1 Tax=Brevundimonas sp. TaxID=1871086 RepID=UPI0037BF2F26